MMFDENNKIFFYLIQFIKLTIFVTRKYNVMRAPVRFLYSFLSKLIVVFSILCQLIHDNVHRITTQPTVVEVYRC